MRVIDTRTGAATDAPAIEGEGGTSWVRYALSFLALAAFLAWQYRETKGKDAGLNGVP